MWSGDKCFQHTCKSWAEVNKAISVLFLLHFHPTYEYIGFLDCYSYYLVLLESTYDSFKSAYAAGDLSINVIYGNTCLLLSGLVIDVDFSSYHFIISHSFV